MDTFARNLLAIEQQQEQGEGRHVWILVCRIIGFPPGNAFNTAVLNSTMSHEMLKNFLS